MSLHAVSTLLLAAIAMWAARAEAQPNPTDDSKAVAKSDDGFTLENSLSIRDPFRKVVKGAAGGEDGDEIPELQRYDVDKFRLVGVITGPKKSKAMITTPDGKMHIVKEGDMLGVRRGVIRKIDSTQIEIEEKVVNLLGQEEKVETLIEFREPDESQKGSL